MGHVEEYRMIRNWTAVLAIVVAFAWVGPALAEESADYVRTRDVIYGRKYGLALTMDVFAPKAKANGIGVISVVSGGWFSGPQHIHPAFYKELLRRGYTVFAVVHGSQPKFTIDEIAHDMNRAVRFIRYNAKTYKIDPDRLGIMGASAGGHLSLLQGTAGTDGDAKAKDPVDSVSSRVQSVGCYCPPTDFLNWGKKGAEMIDRQFQPPFTAAADYHEFDRKTARFYPITDKKKLREIAKRLSPITHVGKESAPALILHGDKDDLVPIQQAESIVARYKDAGVPVKLIVRKGARHVWPTFVKDMTHIGDWFDEHLAKVKDEKNLK
jgi:acetyl esterase/lipase